MTEDEKLRIRKMKAPTVGTCKMCGASFWYDAESKQNRKTCCSKKCAARDYYYRHKEECLANDKIRRARHKNDPPDDYHKYNAYDNKGSVSKAYEMLGRHKPIPKPKESINDISIKARKEGLSYGEYVAKQYIAEHKIGRRRDDTERTVASKLSKT